MTRIDKSCGYDRVDVAGSPKVWLYSSITTLKLRCGRYKGTGVSPYLRDIRPRAEEKARRRVEALHASQSEGEERLTGKGFESERARARQALREEVSAQRGQSVQKIAAASGEKDDGRILRVAAYCRVSTDDIDQVISIELQKNNYRDMIRANPKWKYAGTYVDDGFSGTNTEHRPAFNLMMKDAMAGKIDMIITKSVSRFARNLLDCIGWVRRLKEHEPPIPVFFEQEHLNTLDNTSNIILFVLAMVAEEESHMKSEAMLLSLEWRFSRGRFLTPALLGYDRVEVPDGHGGRKKVLSVNEDEARTVRLMYYMLLSGSSPAEIAATLTELSRETGLRKVVRPAQRALDRFRGEQRDAQRALLRRCTGAQDVDAQFSRSQVSQKPWQKEQVLPAWAPRGHRDAGAVERRPAHPQQPPLRPRWKLPAHAGDRPGRPDRLHFRQPRMAGYEADEYYRVSSIAMGLEEGDLEADLEAEHLPDGGHRIAGPDG